MSNTEIFILSRICYDESGWGGNEKQISHDV
jgi:hypothetical protein